MPRFTRLPLTSRSAVSADVDDEIRAHLEERQRQLVEQGVSPDEARRVALQRFGNVEATRRAMRDSAERHASRLRRRDWLSGLAQDVRHSVRQLRRTPGFAVVVILTLGLGIGATATMFGVVDRLLLRPPPHVRDPGRLGRLYTSHIDEDNRAVDQDEVSYLRFSQLRDGARDVADVAAMGKNTSVIVGRGETARRVPAGFVSANFWQVLGVKPALGRFFGADEDRPPDGANVVVLGHAYWRVALGADSSVLGREMAIGGRPVTVIGVAPRDFRGIASGRIDVWLPVTSVRLRQRNAPADWYAKNNLWWLTLVARLHPAATPRQAEAKLTATFARVNMGGTIDDATVRERARVVFGPLLEERGPRRQESTRVALWLAAIAGIVLLLACSNVANLLLARAIRRRREIALRIALGVSRQRLFALLLTEGLLLSTAGAALGMIIAVLGGRVFWRFLLPGVAPSEQLFDGRVLIVATSASIVAGVLASLAPGLYAWRQDIGVLMKPTSRDSTRRLTSRTVLLAGQCALSTMLLLGAGLFIRSLQQARAEPLGFDTRGLITVTAEQLDTNGGRDAMAALYRRFAERVRSVPGVLHATTTVQIPFRTSASTTIAVPGIDSASLDRLGQMLINPVGDDYFETMGTRIIRGRGLGKQDVATSTRVMVVSDSMARALWPSADPIGKCVKVGGADQPCSIVVGVAENIHQYEIRAEPALQYWVPESQNQDGNGGAYAVMVRVAGDAHAMFPALRLALQREAPPSTFVSLTAVEDAVSGVVRPWRIGAMVLTAFGVLGLIIAALGLYSVLAYMVSQRSAEIGIRMALGATPPSVIASVITDGIRVVLIGVVAGLVVALAGGRWINAILFGVTTTDPLVLPLTIAVLLTAALVASAVPAWRASRVDPAEALRAE